MKHLDLLAHAGLVQVQTKGREKRYVFNPESLQVASAWDEQSPTHADAMCKSGNADSQTSGRGI